MREVLEKKILKAKQRRSRTDFGGGGKNEFPTPIFLRALRVLELGVRVGVWGEEKRGHPLSALGRT